MGSKKDKSAKATSKRARCLARCGLPADPSYQEFWEWGHYARVSIDHYRQLRKEGMLPEDEKVLLFREPGAIFYRPPSYHPPVKEAPVLSISQVKTVISIAPAIEANDNNNGTHALIPKAAIRSLKLHARATRELLQQLGAAPSPPPVPKATDETPVSPSPAEPKTPPQAETSRKLSAFDDGFKTPVKKSASQPPSPKTDELSCRKCEAMFRSRNALFDHVYSNTCKPSSQKPRLATPSSKSSKTQSFIITSDNTPVSQTAANGSALARLTPAAVSPAPSTSAPAPSSSRHSTPTVTVLLPVSKPRRHMFPLAPAAVSPAPRPAAPASQSNSQAATPYNCRTCKASFHSRNLLFKHLQDRGHRRPAGDLMKASPVNGNGLRSSLNKIASWRSTDPVLEERRERASPWRSKSGTRLPHLQS